MPKNSDIFIRVKKLCYHSYDFLRNPWRDWKKQPLRIGFDYVGDILGVEMFRKRKKSEKLVNPSKNRVNSDGLSHKFARAFLGCMPPSMKLSTEFTTRVLRDLKRVKDVRNAILVNGRGFNNL